VPVFSWGSQPEQTSKWSQGFSRSTNFILPSLIF
jgi:hypothetical protein